MLTVLFTESSSATTWTLWISHSNSTSALSNTPQRPRQNTFKCLYMQNANIFLSATVPCYIAASLLISIRILRRHFPSLSACVMSNVGLDLCLRSNRGRLPLPAARFWGLPAWDWSFLSAWWARRGTGGSRGERERGREGDRGRTRWRRRNGRGEGGCIKRETPGVVPEVSICRQEVCNMH